MNRLQTLEMALKALENGKRVRNFEGGTKYQPDLEDTAIAALRQQIALEKKAENARELGLDYGPADEPVAVILEDMKGGGYIEWLNDTYFVSGTKFYTRPQKAAWVELTDEEKIELKNTNMPTMALIDTVCSLLKKQNT